MFGDPDIDGFYYAELESGRRGYVPADCLQPAAGAATAGTVSSSRAVSSDRRSTSRPVPAPSSTAAQSASGHRGVADPNYPMSSSAPPPSTRHHHDGSSRSTGRRHPRDDSVEATAAGGRSSSATMPRSADRSRAADLAATADTGGGRGGTADGTTRHRRQ